MSCRRFNWSFRTFNCHFDRREKSFFVRNDQSAKLKMLYRGSAKTSARALTRTIVILLLLLSREALSQSTSRTSVSLIYEAIAATNATLWLAEDARLFQKYGLDAKVVHARGAIPVQALVGGSVEFGAFSGSSTVAAVLAGSDLVFVAAKGNFAVMSFWVRRDSLIKSRRIERKDHRCHARRLGDP